MPRDTSMFSEAASNFDSSVWDELTKKGSILNTELGKIRKELENTTKTWNNNATKIKDYENRINKVVSSISDLQKKQKNSNNLTEQETKKIEASIKAKEKVLKTFKSTQKRYIDYQKKLKELSNTYKETVASEIKAIDSQEKLVNELEKSSTVLTKYKKAIKETTWQQIIDNSGDLRDEIGKQKKEYVDLIATYNNKNKDMIKLKNTFISLKNEISKLQNQEQNSSKISDEMKKKIQEEIKLKNNQISATSKEIKAINDSQREIKDKIDAVEDYVSAEKEAISEEEELAAKTTIVGKINNDVKREIEGLAGGLGEQAVGVTAAAIAFVYLGEKIEQYGDSILGLQKNWAEYNVQASIAARTTPDFSGGIGGVNNLRNELALTRDESINFQKALREGANSGISSTTDLVEAAKKLTTTFGDDPTERLSNYVELLRSIPTLDTDLSITASLDDQAAAWFALAEQGKVSQAIELQMAGLLGGAMEVPEDQMETAVESLKTQREMATSLENIESLFAQYIPEQTAALVKSVAALTQGVGTVVGIYTGIGVLSSLSKKIKDGPAVTVNAIKNVEKAVRGTKSGGMGGKPALSSRDVLRKTGSAFGRGFGRARSAGTGLIGATTRGMGGAGGTLIQGGKALGGTSGLGLTALGGAFKALSANVGSVGTTLSGLGSTTAAVAGGMTAAAGLLGAAVGPFVAIGLAGEYVGDALSDFSNKVNKQGGYAASRFDKVSLAVMELFNPLNLVGISLGDFGEMLSHAGKYWSNLAGSVYDYIFVSQKEMDERKNSIARQKEENKLRNEVANSLRKTQQSALAMEEALNLIKSASESPITALAKLGQEITKMDFEQFTIAGGTVGDFNRALASGVKNTVRELEQMDKAFAKARRKIIENGEMTAEHRRAALLKLHKAEMEATKTFIEGMMNLIGRFDSIPEVAAEELRIGMRNVAKELTLDVGVGIFGDASDMFVENIRSSMNSLGAATEQLAQDFENQRQASEMVSKRLSIDTVEVGKELSIYRKEILESTNGMINSERKKDAALIEQLESAVSTGDTKKAESVMVQLTESITKVQSEFDNLASVDLSTNASRLSLEYKKAQSEMSKSFNTLQEMEKQEEKSNEDLVAIEQQREKAIKLAENVAKVGTEILGNDSEIRAITAKRLKVGIDSEKITKKEIENTKKNLKNEFEKRNALGRQLIALEESRNIAEKIAMGASEGVFNLQASKKSLDALNERMQGFLNSINALAERIDRDPYVQSLQRAVEAKERETDLELRLGTSATAVTELVSKRQQKIERQLDIVNENKKIIEGMIKGGAEQERILNGVGNTLGALTKTIDKNLDFTKIDKKAQTILKKSTGMGTKELNKIFQKQGSDVRDAYEKLSNAAKEGAGTDELRKLGSEYLRAEKEFSDNLSKAESAIKEVGGDTSIIDSYKKELQAAKLTAQVVVEGAQKQLEINKTQQANLQASWFELYDELDRGVASLRDTIIQKSAAATIAASQSLAELSKVQFDLVGANKAYNKGLAATEKAYNDIINQIEARQKAVLMKLQDDLAEAQAMGDVNRQAAIREKIEQQTSRFAEERTKAEKEMLDATKQMRDNLQEAAMATLNIRKEEIDIQLDLAQTMGANMGHIFDLQMEQLSIARQERDVRLDIFKKTEEAYQKGAASEEDLARSRVEYAKAAAEVQKKALGAQRDAYDRLLDKTFGAIRQSRGARRQLMTRTQMFGRGFVQSQATGLVGGGRAMTLAQRQAANAAGATAWGSRSPNRSEKITDDAVSASNKQLDAANIQKDAANVIKESFGGLVTIFNKFGGALNMTNIPTATRQPIESMVEENMRGNRLQEKTLTNVEKQTNAQTTKGSIYTHDSHVEGVLKEMLMNNNKEVTLAEPPPMTREGFDNIQTRIPTKAGQDMRIHVDLGFSVDKNGNIIPVVKNIVKQEIPSAIKSPATQSILQQQGFVKA